MGVSDEELVAKVIATRDQAAFAELVRRHQSGIRNWLRHLSGDHARGDDLAQDTFVRAWDKLHTFRGRGKFRAWLMKLAYNEFLQERRGAARDLRLAEAVQADPTSARNVSEPGPDTGVTDLPRMLAILGEDERVAMVLNYAYGMSHGEISEVTGLPLGTVKSHVSRGRDKIRKQFLAEDSRS